jgi:hypothetical protein
MPKVNKYQVNVSYSVDGCVVDFSVPCDGWHFYTQGEVRVMIFENGTRDGKEIRSFHCSISSFIFAELVEAEGGERDDKP